MGRAVAWKPDHDAGCWAQFRVGTGDDGDALLAEVGDGLLDAFSVGFQPIRTQRGADGAREILEARLHEVSIAPIGAYDGARVLAMRTPHGAAGRVAAAAGHRLVAATDPRPLDARRGPCARVSDANGFG